MDDRWFGLGDRCRCTAWYLRMSITVEYWFNAEHDFPTLVSHVGKTIGAQFMPYEGNQNDQFCRFLGMEFTFQIADGFTNDGECNFEDYNYILNTRTPVPDGDLRPIQIQTMAAIAFVLYKRLSVDSGLLTYDTQLLLARYEVRDGDWYDIISNSIVEFPQHLQDLCTQR